MMRSSVSSTNSDFFIVERIRRFGVIEPLGHVYQTWNNGYYYDIGKD